MPRNIRYSNSDLLNYYGATTFFSVNRMIYSFAVILLLMISFGSVSLIYNSFSISVAERTRQFGILKSIGATRKQIRDSVLYEALVLCAVGIPLGLLVGCLGIGITLYCLRDSFGFLMGESGNALQMHFVLNGWALLAAAGIGLVTAIISAWIPAKRAVRVSPVEAIRQTKDVKLRGREVRTSRLTEKLFGFSGMLAAKNFKRNRKRYRSTVVGLFLSVTLFISASSFCAYLTDAVDQLGGDSTLGVQLYYSEALPEGVTPEQRLGQLAAADGVAMLDVLMDMEQYPSLARASSALGGFVRIYNALCQAHDTLPLDAFVNELVTLTGYKAMLENAGEEGQTRLENIGQLVSSVKTYADQRGPEASLEVLLVLDAITGQNAISQAHEFCRAASATGVVLTKLDGTPRGGCAVSVWENLGLPIRFIGVGEKIDDLMEFDAQTFVESLLPESALQKEEKADNTEEGEA